MLERVPLRSRVCDALRGWIIHGQLGQGERLGEPQLAERLGVSRTPVREALVHLEREGLVESEVGKGFRVARLSVEMIREVYPILGALERLALRLVGRPPGRVLRRLGKINQAIAAAGADKAAQYEHDRDWHVLLLETCPNRRLLGLIRDHTGLVRRFDGAVRRGVADLDASCRQHAEILARLEAHDLDGACEALERHWVSCVAPVERWLRRES